MQVIRYEYLRFCELSCGQTVLCLTSSRDLRQALSMSITQCCIQYPQIRNNKKNASHCFLFLLQLDEDESGEGATGQGPVSNSTGKTANRFDSNARQVPLHFFRPMVEWPLRYGGPPLSVNMEKDFNIPTEEVRLATPGAVEAAKRVSVRPKVSYPNPMAVPATPLEAPSEPMPAAVPISIPLDQSQQQPAAQIPAPVPAQTNPPEQAIVAQQPIQAPVRTIRLCASCLYLSQVCSPKLSGAVEMIMILKMNLLLTLKPFSSMYNICFVFPLVVFLATGSSGGVQKYPAKTVKCPLATDLVLLSGNGNLPSILC